MLLWTFPFWLFVQDTQTMPADPINPDPTGPAPEEGVGLSSRRRLRNLRLFCTFAALFSLALWGSMQIRSHLTQDGNPPDLPGELSKDGGKEIVKAASPVEVRARGDNALRQLRYAEALSHYQQLLKIGLNDGPALDYRLGLCNESVGALAEAISYYRQAVGAAASPALTFACHLGMARCLLRQKRPVEARRLLYPFLFDEMRHQNAPPVFVTDAYYLVALSHAHEGAARDGERLFQDDPISFASVPLEVRIYLEDPVPGEPKRGEAAAPVPLVVQKRSESEPALVLSAEQSGQPALELLEKLAAAGEMKTAWTAQAKQSLADRTLPMHLHNWVLRDVLEHCADYLDLACWIDDDKIHFSTQGETDGKRLTAIRHGVTQRSLEAALRADPAHPLTAAALLEYGNNEAIQGRWNEAAFWYNRLIRDASASPYVITAYYNTARLRLRTSEFGHARKAFFRVIDQAPGHELALRAAVQISQTYLQEDQARPAIALLRRAGASGGDSPYRPVATLTLAAAFLQDGDLESARKTLVQNRAGLQAPPYRSTAAFLDSYVQYRLAKGLKETNASRREVADMVGTLWRNRDDTILGPYGQWLVAQAYHDLGFSDEAERLLRRALPEARGPFKASVEYALAETLLKKGQHDEAARMFAQCAEPESRHRVRAIFQLARLDLEQKRFRECAEACGRLWRERPFPEESALLAVWGAALEGSGDLAKAAMCYAGKAPE
jgi:tetratricopeptide (TPR) repeat protein